MIAVVVPAHNEEALLGRCLSSLFQAARHPGLLAEPVLIVVVLDACTDQSQQIAASLGVATLMVDVCNVGQARRIGSAHAIARGARWLACTDADSYVAPDWLYQQLRHGAEVVCGTVHVEDWEGYGHEVQAAYQQRYCSEDGHRHIHGANLGVCAAAYQRVGGFPPLATHEDVSLVQALQNTGAHIVWTGQNRVMTSARKNTRARSGFGEHLAHLAAQLTPDGERSGLLKEA